jgi:hypothetical protein
LCQSWQHSYFHRALLNLRYTPLLLDRPLLLLLSVLAAAFPLARLLLLLLAQLLQLLQQLRREEVSCLGSSRGFCGCCCNIRLLLAFLAAGWFELRRRLLLLRPLLLLPCLGCVGLLLC